MKIGLLAYHASCNFGANLQLLSTIGYLKKRFHEVVVINWYPESLERYYEKQTPKLQVEVHRTFREKYYSETALCRTALDVAHVVDHEKIEAIIIGSDAVAQHHPFLSRIGFPTKKIISINKFTEDRMFPNPFWGNFVDYLERKIPIAILSASCQNSNYFLFSNKIKGEMYNAIKKYSYISVRDDWTQNLYKCVTDGKVIPPVTPDPVFAFNYNIDFIPSKQYILDKYGLPEKYILLSFLNSYSVSEIWIEKFTQYAKNEGFTCVALPFPKGICFKNSLNIKIDIPLCPLEWYALIKYSSGYVGHNMHPIVVALHNSIPFFSFDNYGISKFKLFVNERSSKIYHILSVAGFLENRISTRSFVKKTPTPEFVFDKLKYFDVKKCLVFADQYLVAYKDMMKNLMKQLILIEENEDIDYNS